MSNLRTDPQSNTRDSRALSP